MVSVSVLSRVEDLVELTTEWWALWRNSCATPFQSPAWLLPWINEFAWHGLCVFVVRRDGNLVGLLPLYKLKDEHGLTLRPCGAGVSDYLDGLFEPSLESAVVATIFADLALMSDGGLRLELPRLARVSPLARHPTPAGWTDEREDDEPCPVFLLPDSAEDLSLILPKRMAQNLRYYSRRAERAGDPQFESAVAADTALALFDGLARLHETRWSERGQSGVLSDPGVQRFHRAAIPMLIEAGMLRLYGLRLEGVLMAALYALAAKQRTFYYLGGFDPSYAALGLGTLIIGHAIEEAVREGCREFDFLKGREAYKYHWGAQDQAVTTRRLSFHARYG